MSPWSPGEAQLLNLSTLILATLVELYSRDGSLLCCGAVFFARMAKSGAAEAPSLRSFEHEYDGGVNLLLVEPLRRPSYSTNHHGVVSDQAAIARC